MAGREEQKRRQFAIEREVKSTRDRALRELLEVCEHGDLDLVKGYIQAQLGMTKPFAEVRRELEVAPHGATQERFAERPSDCDWCGRTVKTKELRIIQHGTKLFTVCASCPPPDNANGMRI